MRPIAFRRANLESQTNGGLHSLGGKPERRKLRSALHSVVPLGSDCRSPGPVQIVGDLDIPMQKQYENVGVLAESSCWVLFAISRVNPEVWDP
jgi:hypothetical protein